MSLNGGVVKRQTQRSLKPPPVQACGFESHHPHHQIQQGALTPCQDHNLQGARGTSTGQHNRVYHGPCQQRKEVRRGSKTTQSYQYCQ